MNVQATHSTPSDLFYDARYSHTKMTKPRLLTFGKSDGCPRYQMQQRRRASGQNEGVPGVRWLKACADGVLGGEKRTCLPYGTKSLYAFEPLLIADNVSCKARISEVTMLSMTWQQQPMMGAKSVHGMPFRQGPARKMAQTSHCAVKNES
jgi:hypothetical protein